MTCDGVEVLWFNYRPPQSVRAVMCTWLAHHGILVQDRMDRMVCTVQLEAVPAPFPELPPDLFMVRLESGTVMTRMDSGTA